MPCKKIVIWTLECYDMTGADIKSGCTAAPRALELSANIVINIHSCDGNKETSSH